MMKFGFGTRRNPHPFPLTEDCPRFKEVHGVDVVEVFARSQECGEVDALWTRLKGYPIGVYTADCVPLLLERKDQQAIGAIHAGWRGTQARILEVFFERLPVELSNPREWTMRIGPSIRGCCFDVSSDLIQTFVNTFGEVPRTEMEPTTGMLDLVAVNRRVAEKLGLEIAMVHPDCTACTKEPDGELRYFSYRRGDRLRRLYSMIQL